MLAVLMRMVSSPMAGLANLFGVECQYLDLWSQKNIWRAKTKNKEYWVILIIGSLLLFCVLIRRFTFSGSNQKFPLESDRGINNAT